MPLKLSIGRQRGLADLVYGLNSINRNSLLRFLRNRKQKDGSFLMHANGEADVRGSYCALAIASLCNVLTTDIIEGAAEFVGRCQTYEGGLGGSPGAEAHGGYTYCGVAALAIMNRLDVLNVPQLHRWMLQRQMRSEGGFNGRTQKLVDGCYSFWVAALFPIVESALKSMAMRVGPVLEGGFYTYDQAALQEYIMICAQDPRGGLRDKPSKFELLSI